MISDLSEKFISLAIDTIRFCKSIPRSVESEIIVKQLIRSATSIGANYQESQKSYSRKEFFQKISLALKEANESQYWITILKRLNYKTNVIENDIDEAVKILSSIISKRKKIP